MGAKKGNKGGADERTRGALVRKRAKVSFDPKVFGRGKNDIQISQGSSCFVTRTGRGRGFLYPARQDQTHRRFRARQGSSRRNPGTRPLFWRRMSKWPSAAHRTNKGGGWVWGYS